MGLILGAYDDRNVAYAACNMSFRSEPTCTICIDLAGYDPASAKASSGDPLSHVSNCEGSDSRTGMRSWLMLTVSSFGPKYWRREGDKLYFSDDPRPWPTTAPE